MLSLNLGRLFNRTPPPGYRPPSTPSAPGDGTSGGGTSGTAEAAAAGPWPPARLAVNDKLWGPGFTSPGGEPEALRLVRPLGANADNRLLLLGTGAGGVVKAIADATQTTLSALDSEPALLAATGTLLAQGTQKRRVKLAAWDPALPRFGKAAHHNCLALEPLRLAAASLVLPALTTSIAAGGSLVVTNLIAIDPIDPRDRLIARWANLERRDPSVIPTAAQVASVLDGNGLDLRIAEDISQRHMDQILYGWRQLMSAIATAKPTRAEAAFVVAEAEQWLLRRKLIENGRLRMMRWHTIRKF